MGIPVKCIRGGVVNADAPEWILSKWENEALAMDVANHETLWKASEAAIGEEFSL